MKKYKYSECFLSIQGEGKYTGVPSVFLRFWGCNFTCEGFKCDTEYSWHKDYNHMLKRASAGELMCEIEKLCPAFTETYHLVITGGEPMLSQSAFVEILYLLEKNGNLPSYVTIETNGTQMPRLAAAESISDVRELLWSVSPKLSISGENWINAIQPDVVAAYAEISKCGQLKYVVDGSAKCWDEVEIATQAFRDAGVEFPVWIMPVGATTEQLSQNQEQICIDTVTRGYNFSPRAHAWIFGDKPGT